MIVEAEGSAVNTVPTQGVDYNINDKIGNGTVIYKGTYMSFLQSGLSATTHYFYNFYTDNNNYYSALSSSVEKDIITPNKPSCTFKVYIGNDTTICGIGSLTLNPGLNVSPFGDTLVITYNSTKGVTQLAGASKVYMHSGVELHEYGGWQYEVGNWGKDDGVGEMKNIGKNLWQIRINPVSYYGFSPDSSIFGIFMVFRNQDTLEGKDDSNNDIYIEMSFNPPVSNFEGVTVAWKKSKYNSIKWFKDNDQLSTINDQLTIDTVGKYSVLITDTNGCIGKDSLVFNLAGLPDIYIGNDTTICEGNPLFLNAGFDHKAHPLVHRQY